MSLKRNILANYFGMGAVVLAPILTLPWYLSELGPKLFGLIGFIAMLQAILGILDVGMSQAFVREVAVRFDAADKGRYRTATLLYGFERIYWVFALCAGFVVVLLADTIATHWLNLEGLSVTTGREAVYGAAAIFAVQFPGSIYRSLMVGVQAQVALNNIMAGGTLLRHVGGVVVVVVWPILSAYLIWHATIALLETLTRGRWAWGTLRVKRAQVKWDANELRLAWRLVAGLSGATLFGVLTVQMDKIILSRMVSIEQFGYYAIAASVVLGALQLIYPLTQAVLPRAIQLRADNHALRMLYVRLTLMIGLLTGLGVILFLIFGKGLLIIWLHNPQIAEIVFPLMAVLLLGALLNAFYNVGYIHWIVRENTRRIVQVNAIALLLAMALIPPLVSAHGVIGAAAGWVTINLVGFLLSLGWFKDTAR